MGLSLNNYPSFGSYKDLSLSELLWVIENQDDIVDTRSYISAPTKLRRRCFISEDISLNDHKSQFYCHKIKPLLRLNNGRWLIIIRQPWRLPSRYLIVSDMYFWSHFLDLPEIKEDINYTGIGWYLRDKFTQYN